uniref:Ribonuclease toxin, BrnT, of type II toxin-antitoxin system n=1 Tax=Candidatus Kentrum sp. LFY TaxID=2126342 RepID=A0A450VB87_9GAMM|nr:MAG: Ribonuclease toxin, BrnT, of type II toxin-antitoxin system [Candidatus Kentron sp. LFY]
MPLVNYGVSGYFYKRLECLHQKQLNSPPTHRLPRTWDFAKHRISFEEATTGFEDPLFIDFFDPDYSQDECRYILLGYSDQMRLLLISYTKEE